MRSCLLLSVCCIASLTACGGPDREPPPGVPLASLDLLAEPWEGSVGSGRWDLPFRVVNEAVADSEAFIMPALVHVDPTGGHLFVFDYGLRDVLRVNRDLEILNGYSKGTGKGPGETQNPIAIAVDDDGHVFIADTYKRSIEVYALDGDYVKTIRLQGQPFRMCRVGDRIVVQIASMEAMFAEFRIADLLADAQPEPVRTFGAVNGNALLIMTAAGDLALAGSRLVYVQTYRPAFFVFDLQQGTYSAYPTRDAGAYDADDPESETTQQGGIGRPPSGLYSGSAFASGDTLFVQSRYTLTDTETTIDAYDVVTGSYLGSIRIPRRVSEASGAGTMLFLQSRTERTWLARRVKSD